MEPKTTAEKMRELLRVMQINQGEFAKLIGYKTQASISRLAKGYIEPGAKAKMIDLLYMVYKQYGEQFLIAFRDGTTIEKLEPVKNIDIFFDRISILETELMRAVNIIFQLQPLQTEANKTRYRELNTKIESFLTKHEKLIEI